ncbi:unnamed protein product [Spirodela intermedia]|uniref:VQ domain-containing protein n=1 Tax=Spirodela intermedia TaxID=51605 RepID=A0ABN7EB12_SPIIN|nr:unnamed protein product [Spirodela intermedia]
MDKLPPPGRQRDHPPSTTFVHADATSFREVVQRLTGPLDEARGGATVRPPSPPPFGLQERRQGPPRPALVIPNPVAVQGLTFTPVTSPGITSPSSPSIAGRWSPLTSPSTDMAKLSIVEEAAAGQEKLNEAAEERAIKERGSTCTLRHGRPGRGRRSPSCCTCSDDLAGHWAIILSSRAQIKYDYYRYATIYFDLASFSSSNYTFMTTVKTTF